MARNSTEKAPVQLTVASKNGVGPSITTAPMTATEAKDFTAQVAAIVNRPR